MLYVKCGVSDEYGNTIIPYIYDKIKILFNNYIRVWKEGKVGLYNPVGKLLIEVQYEDIFVFDKKIYVKKHDKIGLYNMEGEMLIPCIFDKIIDKDTYFIVYLKDKKGIYDMENDIIIMNCKLFENKTL